MVTVTSQNCLKKYGQPSASNKHLVVWFVPKEIHDKIPTIPLKIFLNKDIIEPLTKALQNVIEEGLEEEIHTWDGCFNIRAKRGLTSMSLHSWGIAVDINAYQNPLGKVPKMNMKLVACFVMAGFEWGGTWKRPDGMHFQLQKI
jgi:hypothetical protein